MLRHSSVAQETSTVYGDYAVVEGQRIYFKSRIRTWDSWPDDVRALLSEWNHERRLSFRNESFWGGLATGFAAFTLKCVRCARLFNSSGSTAARMDGAWYCDDCIIALARNACAISPAHTRGAPKNTADAAGGAGHTDTLSEPGKVESASWASAEPADGPGGSVQPGSLSVERKEPE